jgi:phosphoenolpyruvate phosphomutase
LLNRLVGTLKDGGVRAVTVVRGYRKETITTTGIGFVDNDDYATTGEVASLACAKERLVGHCVVVYGDVLFRRYILDGVLAAEDDIVVAVDALWQARNRPGNPRVRDFAAVTRRFSADYLDEEPARLISVGAGLAEGDIAGEWIGLLRLSPKGAEQMQAEIAALAAERLLPKADLPLLLTRLAAKYPVAVHYVTGHWLDVDDLADLADARNFL